MKSVLITGASRGLGLEFARQYAQAGYRVFATCRNPNEATELQALLPESSGRLHIVALDVMDENSMKAAREVVRAHGDRLDVLEAISKVWSNDLDFWSWVPPKD